ncbi:translesion error-prone DNA polymerase V autoproteolytic subunit [Hymenobacter sp. M29]|uniref:Translesion error-prone DNA polymerase V autoproteolytic subunit n=1 Tax=Hymenobacter mellowenesis TaxID=3063995 RepID=A0ABT9AC22_9BACT|nr:translesion error-prone DNA polymerase V autoproteolytic subunit [Hymenobacter sp. M29]MDO7846277.1 translesion error-prone DNA polymerase V autoproteolytic subunit [Hymenobacter sp. M29]
MTTVDILQIAREPVWFIQCDTRIPAGFPSPAEDETGELVDLNKILLPHPTHTYLARVNGTSMDGPPSHIVDGALLAVDCALKPQPGQVVVAAVDGEFTLKRLVKRGDAYWLEPDNPTHAAIEILRQGQVKVWGVVTHVVTELINGKLHADVRARRLQ